MTDYAICGRTKRDGSGDPCTQPAGWGTDHVGEGACKLHGGMAGAPIGNQNGTTHALNADPYHYHENLPPEEKEFIEEMAGAIEDRVRKNTGTIDHMDRVLSRRVAIEFHMESRAMDYIADNELTQNDGTRERTAALLEVVRQFSDSIFKNLKTMGVLNDPQTKQRSAIESWRKFLASEDKERLESNDR